MRILINEREREVEAESSLADILQADYGSCPQGLAMAVNDEVVPRSQWQQRSLVEGDHLLIVQAVQGG